MKEAPQSNYKPIFREVFSDESSVIRNGGTPNNVSFENGIGKFLGTSASNIMLPSSIIKSWETYTIRVRCKFDDLVNDGIVFMFGDGTNRTVLSRRITNTGTGLSFATVTGGISRRATTSNTLESNKWIEYTCVNAGGTNVFIYVNGILQSGSGVGWEASAVNEFRLSGRSTGYDFKGEMDLVEIYDRALTASEVKNLYSG
jgi:hypothetical protein